MDVYLNSLILVSFPAKDKCLTLPESSRCDRNLQQDINSPEQWVSFVSSFYNILQFVLKWMVWKLQSTSFISSTVFGAGSLCSCPFCIMPTWPLSEEWWRTPVPCTAPCKHPQLGHTDCCWQDCDLLWSPTLSRFIQCTRKYKQNKCTDPHKGTLQV